MRISMIFLSEYRPEPRIHKQAKTLSSAGHDVTVFALQRKDQSEEEELSGYRVKRINLISDRLRGKLIAPLLKYIEYNLRLMILSLAQPANVYQANDAKALPITWLCASISRNPFVYDARELETGRDFGSFRLSGIYRRLWSLPETLFIRSAAAVLTVSESIASELARRYVIPHPTVVMNCPETISPVISNRLREELFLPKDLCIALYQGSVSAGHGIEPFLKAIQLLSNIVGVVLGDGPWLGKLRTEAQSGKWQRVYFPGRVPMDTLPSYIASADVGIVLIEDSSLSHRYSLPNKLFEYLQACIPVIASDLPEISRIVHDFEVGDVASPSDPQAVATAIHDLLEDEARYSLLKYNARQAAKILNWETEGQKFLTIYQKLELRGRE
jgi:glycosyltransferase involved in cell wall biosynthesis